MKKIKQGFDEKANEYVFVIEYRVMRGDNLKLTKKKRKEEGELRRAKKRKGELLRDLMAVTGDESPHYAAQYGMRRASRQPQQDANRLDGKPAQALDMNVNQHTHEEALRQLEELDGG